MVLSVAFSRACVVAVAVVVAALAGLQAHMSTTTPVEAVPAAFSAPHVAVARPETAAAAARATVVALTLLVAEEAGFRAVHVAVARPTAAFARFKASPPLVAVIRAVLLAACARAQAV